MVISLPVLNCSVLDLDWCVFGSLGSGSIIICTDPDPFFRKQNNLDKPRFILFCDFSNDMKCCTYRKKFAKKLGILNSTAKKRRIRIQSCIRNPVYGSCSVQNATDPEHCFTLQHSKILS